MRIHGESDGFRCRTRGGGRALCALGVAALLGSCGSGVKHHAPPRATGGISIPAQRSVIAVPVSADLTELEAALDGVVPQRLWTIDKPGQTCAASRKVKVLFAKIRTPTITCRIVGTVTRGSIALGGSGQDIVVTMPIHATLSARDIGHVIGEETATADARVRAIVRLGMTGDWTPRGTVRIRYDWTDSPHVDILGQRIDFTEKADAKLGAVIRKLQATLPEQLAKLGLRDRIAKAWRGAFTSVALNKADPKVWMRVSPSALAYGGYAVAGRTLTLRLGMAATTETFVGPRPPDPTPVPLPPPGRFDAQSGQVVFAIPVIASYQALEPVLAKALAKRAQRPFDVPGIGAVNARFDHVTAYGTSGGRIAVGLGFAAAVPGGKPSHGTVWLTAKPVNTADSRRVGFTDLSVDGVTDSTGAGLLIRLANAPGLSTTIADALHQNFSGEYDRLLAKISTAIDRKRLGDLLIRATITDVRTGRLQATGQGVYLPVEGRGNATITLDAR